MPVPRGQCVSRAFFCVFCQQSFSLVSARHRLVGSRRLVLPASLRVCLVSPDRVRSLIETWGDVVVLARMCSPPWVFFWAGSPPRPKACQKKRGKKQVATPSPPYGAFGNLQEWAERKDTWLFDNVQNFDFFSLLRPFSLLRVEGYASARHK